MIQATDLKNGRTFLLEKKPYKVVKYSHSKIARGGGNVKLEIRNLESGKLEKQTLSSNMKIEEIATIKKPLQYLFSDSGSAIFMEQSTYEQIEILVSSIKTELQYIKEGETVDVLFWEDRPLSVDLPPKVTLAVLHTDPGVKGDTASNVYKSAKLENGLQVKVPLFIKTGDKVSVDTRTGEYTERAKNNV